MPKERDDGEMPSAPLPAWVQARINTIKSERELRRLLRTEYIGAMAHPAWRKWAAPKLVASRPAADPRYLPKMPQPLQSRQKRKAILLKPKNKRVKSAQR